MANYLDFDQAEGLRRMLAGAKPRVVTFLSATPRDDKGAMLVNLGASLTQAGNEVLLVDACADGGVAERLGVAGATTLREVARQRCPLERAITRVPQGFNVLTLGAARAAARRPARAGADDGADLAQAFDGLVSQAGIVIVDGEFENGCFPVPLMGSSEIVVQVSSSAESITAAYRLIKRLGRGLGQRPLGLLVTGASESEARVIYDNMADAASRYLALNLTSMGSVPADEYLYRAALLGRTVIDAFPMAGASVAFRQLAGRFSGAAAPVVSRAWSANHVGA